MTAPRTVDVRRPGGDGSSPADAANSAGARGDSDADMRPVGPLDDGRTSAEGVGREEPGDSRGEDVTADYAADARHSGAVTIRRDGTLATVHIGTGRRANALRTHDWQVLATVFDSLAQDVSLGAVVVTGRGTNTFSAGSDMREWLSADPSEIDGSFAAMESALSAVERLPVPVIARISGSAVGAGCQLACACDLRIVADDARMGMPIARWGILVPPAFAARIALLTGPATARDLLLTGRLVDGTEAVRLRLATASVPAADLDTATADVVTAITAHPPAAIRAAKRAVDTVIAPTRERLGQLPAGPAVDYDSMQLALGSFLGGVTRAG
ncbi:enoyl-CoA hydratase/isomerase family protein [Streptomyces griseorubiginosus]|uniref:enoyl-CoA hydratase/isomerase family protein n=1 Tax=Streptomyces griseorubiginosus TaxID=67304 RepID=UPI001AD6736C|nr:enoyl-CoA hydratase/isomerase family protein [Streptomyces griseorubiginosus]MBO4253310.1 enoyl-CoA hydratase/isomerase family protein [Streptomyces griseorubiginosus]